MKALPARLDAVLAAFDAYHALVAEAELRAGALFLRDPRAPGVHDANHVRRIATADADVPRLLAEAERHYAALPFRSVRVDARCAAPSLEGHLALAGYAPVHDEVLMVLETDTVRGRPASVRLAPLAVDDDWAAWRALKHLDARTPWFASMADEWVAYVRRKTPPVRYWGAFDGGRLLGAFSEFVHERVGYLEDLLVAPEARLRGIGTALVRRCAEAARERGASLVSVPAAVDDTPKSMYAAMGFAPVGTSRDWLRRLAGDAEPGE